MLKSDKKGIHRHDQPILHCHPFAGIRFSSKGLSAAGQVLPMIATDKINGQVTVTLKSGLARILIRASKYLRLLVIPVHPLLSW
jgi:hypothetical protein